jgi:uncharacterized protein YegL
MTVDYGGNANQRTPCVLILDASGSMNTSGSGGKTRIQELNEGIKTLEQALKNDDAAISRVQLGIVSVGGPSNSAEVLMDWTDVENFEAFPLTADGTTPLGTGVRLGLQMIETVKTDLRENGINYTRPWMMIITDGEPTDDSSEWAQAVTECKQAEANKKVEVFTIAVEGANLGTLSQLSIRPPVKLDGVKFNELFLWLSSSLSAASRSRPGDNLSLPSIDPWRNVGM